MAELVRTGVSIEQDLLDKFDELIANVATAIARGVARD